MISIRRYEANDYLIIQRRKFEMLTFLNFPNPSVLAKTLERGIAFTGVTHKGEIVACGGIIPLWKGVGEAWVVTSPLVERYWLTFAKAIRRRLSVMIESLELERVQTTVDVEHLVSCKWVERMGFINEGMMRKFLGGRDFFRFALVMEK